jgi:phosphoheptose isomerase
VTATQAATFDAHIDRLAAALRSPRTRLAKVWQWGPQLAVTLLAGHRLLVAGNGGSAAQAQHLTAELVGRFAGDRRPLSAIALHAETSSLTAIGNDYGADEAYARQLAAHGRPGDVFLALSTSGRSGNLLAAARRARSLQVVAWALTGPAPNPLAALADDALCVADRDTATIQEAHLMVIHALCAAIDEQVARADEVRLRAQADGAAVGVPARWSA